MLRRLSEEYGLPAPRPPDSPRPRYSSRGEDPARALAQAQSDCHPASVVCRPALGCPDVVPPGSLCPPRAGGSPLPLLQALSNPCPG